MQHRAFPRGPPPQYYLDTTLLKTALFGWEAHRAFPRSPPPQYYLDSILTALRMGSGDPG
eukprot:409590-Pleurochrysis_carterae.AAC.1